MGNTKFHPLTGLPIVPLGYRKDGRPIMPIVGASDDPPPADPPADPPKDPAPSDPPKPPWGDPDNFKPEQAWELIQNLRKEKGDPAKVAELERQLADMQSTQQQQLDAIAKAAGLKADDNPPDPAKLAEQITAEQEKTTKAEERAVAAERKLAVFLAADAHEANAVALLDSTSFLDALRDVDYSDSDALGAAIKAAVEKDARFKAVAPTPPFPGGPRKTPGRPEVSPGLPRLRDAYAQSSQ